jgi:hypothetical protein
METLNKFKEELKKEIMMVKKEVMMELEKLRGGALFLIHKHYLA